MAVSAAIVMVDPISTGGTIAFEAHSRGYEVIAVWCSELQEEFKSHVPDCCKTRGFKFYAHVDEKPSLDETVAAVRQAAGSLPVVACIVGGESGVTLADQLSLELGLRTNGILPYGNRRNKSVQQKAIKAAGLRAVREALGTQWREVEAFVKSETFPIVVKPVESAGSDGVKLCQNEVEAKDHFELLMSSQRKVGSQGAAVLCQEFLRGREYVVDHVSRDGVHKTVMVWYYDKRSTNGSAFVYYGMIPVDSACPEAKTVIEYCRGVLDALQFRNGPTHGEVMMTDDGPCLVEMNCRAHGCDGTWVPLSRALTGGYAQPEVTVSAYLDAYRFAEIPDVMPSPFQAAGQEVMLVSYFSGTVKSTPGYDKLRQLSSFVALQTGIKVGSLVGLTVDLFTAAGILILSHADSKVLENDLSRVRKMEKEGLFEFEETDAAQMLGA